MRSVAYLPSAGLLEQITAELTATGGARAPLESLPVDVDEWRKIARAAARSLGRPVRTLCTEDAVEAYLSDWPATEEEQRVHLATLRAAINRNTVPSEDSDHNTGPHLRPV